MLNAHGVDVSVVNNDASASLYTAFAAALCQLVSQVVVKYDHMYVYIVGLHAPYWLWYHVCNKP